MPCRATAFDNWWDDLWRRADVATAHFIGAYEAKRPLLPTPASALPAGPPDADLQAANEYGWSLRASQKAAPSTQVELLFNGHFFYPDTATPRQDIERPLSLEDSAGTIYNDPGRQIVFNGPPRRPGGNHMWRVYMPTAAMGFVGYQDGDAVVHFRRTGTPDHYLIEVAPARSPQALQWIRSARGMSVRPGPPPRRMGWAPGR
jgi:hypothetical protein